MADLKELDYLVKSLSKKFGIENVSLMGNNLHIIDRWNLKSLNLTDLTCGGLPKGRMIEIYGPESNGKITLATILAADVQSQNGSIAYIDTEHAIDPVYAKTLGLDITKCIFSQPDSGEMAINLAEDLVKSGKIDLIVIDSVAALTPQAELDGEAGDQQMGLQARLMGKACRKLSALISKSKTTIIWINQIRQKIGIVYGNPECVTPDTTIDIEIDL